ncbi:MAG: NUDIX domain-containing protein [Lachnospiraceae bacterium]|nr:NUDIX domain-containing protein [Lachnospiraceae bacterium]
MYIEHKVFGTKKNVNYMDREGVYLVPAKDGKVGVVKTSKGYFLLGGGLDSGESHEECIKRECLEETGYAVSVGKKVCSAETYYEHPTIGYFHPMQTYYVGELLDQVSVPVEEDHEFVWMDYNELVDNMYLEMQSWALEQCMKKLLTFH